MELLDTDEDDEEDDDDDDEKDDDESDDNVEFLIDEHEEEHKESSFSNRNGVSITVNDSSFIRGYHRKRGVLFDTPLLLSLPIALEQTFLYDDSVTISSA